MLRKKLSLDEATRSKDLSGKTYIVTGANSGVGLETTRQLVRQGGHVVLACRRTDAAEEAARSFRGLKGSHEVMRLDLADLQSVRDFVVEFTAKHDRLDGLACNAGLVSMGKGPEYTKDGLEMTIAVSYFGHFLLTELLLDTLRASAPSRVAIVSSVVHAGSDKNRPKVDLDDLNYKRRDFRNFAAYAEAKVATVLYAKELAERLDGTGVTAFSLHPGWARSNFGSGGSLPIRVATGRRAAPQPTVLRQQRGIGADHTALPAVRRCGEPLGRLFQPEKRALPGQAVPARRLADGDPEPEREGHGDCQETGGPELRRGGIERAQHATGLVRAGGSHRVNYFR